MPAHAFDLVHVVVISFQRDMFGFKEGDFLVTEKTGRTGPEGVRGLSEHANDLVPSTIACAISNALGTLVTEYPVCPEKVLKILAARKVT